MVQKQTTRTALVWSAAETFGHRGILLIVYVFLARLISPEDFGLVAMLAVLFSLGQILADSGFSNALIQKKHDDDLDRSTVFYFNLLVGIVLAGTICLSSKSIAEFYDEPILQPLSCVMSLVILASSSGLIQQAITRREMDFRVRTKSAVIAAAGAGGISISMALSGAGVWALAAQMILMHLFQSIMLWYFCEWRPKLAFSYDRLRTMFGFGSKMLVAGLLSAFFNNLIAIVTGKLYSPLEVGYYDTARRYQEFPANNLTSIFSRVTFPAFSRKQDDIARMRNLFLKTLRAASSAVFPVMGLLCGIAHPLFETVLGSKWLPSVPLFQVLCVMGLFQPIFAINLNCLLAQGKSGHFLALEIIKRFIAIVSILITYRYGVFWMVTGTTIASGVCFFVNTYFTEKYLSVSSFRQIQVVAKNGALAVVVGITAYAFTHFFATPIWNLTTGLVAGSLAGLAFLYCFDRETLIEIRTSLRRPVVGTTYQ